jgi:hypothetical protein
MRGEYDRGISVVVFEDFLVENLTRGGERGVEN